MWKENLFPIQWVGKERTHPGDREIIFFMSKITISLFLKIALFKWLDSNPEPLSS